VTLGPLPDVVQREFSYGNVPCKHIRYVNADTKTLRSRDLPDAQITETSRECTEMDIS
jgi:hypothetical protein